MNLQLHFQNLGFPTLNPEFFSGSHKRNDADTPSSTHHLSLHSSWRARLTEDDSVLGYQSKLYKYSRTSNGMLSTVRTAGGTPLYPTPVLSFTFHTCWEKSYFVLPHCSTGKKAHQNNMPALQLSYLTGRWPGSPG